jgi:hypothetical protein
MEEKLLDIKCNIDIYYIIYTHITNLLFIFTFNQYIYIYNDHKVLLVVITEDVAAIVVVLLLLLD